MYNYGLGGWSQSNFCKIFHRSVCTWSVSNGASVSVSDPMVGAVLQVKYVGSIPSGNMCVNSLGMVNVVNGKKIFSCTNKQTNAHRRRVPQPPPHEMFTRGGGGLGGCLNLWWVGASKPL